MTAEVIGWVMLVGAAVPVLSPGIRTGVASTLGLFALALAGLALIAGTGGGTREWLIGGGLVLAGIGELLYWRRMVPGRTGRRRAIDAGGE
jgi:uncharacterized membrane protein